MRLRVPTLPHVEARLQRLRQRVALYLLEHHPALECFLRPVLIQWLARGDCWLQMVTLLSPDRKHGTTSGSTRTPAYS